MNRVDLKTTYFNIIKPRAYLPRPQRIMHSKTNNPLYNSIGIIAREKTIDFHYTLSGEGVYIYNNQEYKVKKGDGFLWVQDNEAISYYYPKNSKEPWEFISFCFWQEDFCLTIMDLIDKSPVFALPVEHPTIRKIMKYLYNGNEIIVSCNEGASIVYELILSLLKLNNEEENDFHPLVNKTKKILENGNANVSEIAVKLGVTREYLSRIFKEYTGETIKDAIIRQRINKACDLLSSSNKPISYISKQLGYSSPSNFSRDFNNTMKISPKEYRLSKNTYFI